MHFLACTFDDRSGSVILRSGFLKKCGRSLLSSGTNFSPGTENQFLERYVLVIGESEDTAKKLAMPPATGPYFGPEHNDMC